MDGGNCILCKHLRPYDEELGTVCDAYPKGIPAPIKIGEADHHDPLPGDHGIQFEDDRPGEPK